jgi:hypothetical protein
MCVCRGGLLTNKEREKNAFIAAIDLKNDLAENWGKYADLF